MSGKSQQEFKILKVSNAERSVGTEEFRAETVGGSPQPPKPRRRTPQNLISFVPTDRVQPTLRNLCIANVQILKFRLRISCGDLCKLFCVHVIDLYLW